jgi:uncharacterized protein YutD
MIFIANKAYEVVVDHKNGWKPDAFKERYSEVLERYDYIVGDWGYNQLRMRGFFKDNHPKATKESTIATFQDYYNEYCNFGCAYFIIEKVPSKHQPIHQPSNGIEPEDQELAEASLEEQPEELQLHQEHIPPPSNNRHQRQNHHHKKQYHSNKQGNPKA